MVLAHNEPPNRIPQPIFFFPSNLQRQVYVIFINDLRLKFPHPLLAPITASVPLIFFSSNSGSSYTDAFQFLSLLFSTITDTPIPITDNQLNVKCRL